MTESNDMTIATMVAQSYANAAAHGFWDEPETVETIPSKLALIMSEMAEALESYRNPKSDQMMPVPLAVVEAIVNVGDNGMSALAAIAEMEQLYLRWREKPRGFDIEIADALIRIFDLCGAKGIDIEDALRRKALYNTGRERMHGRKV